MVGDQKIKKVSMLRGAHFSNAIISDTNFTDADLTDTIFDE